jgi:integrase/recombinase XerD
VNLNARRETDISDPSANAKACLRAPHCAIYLENGGTLEHAQQIAAQQSPRTTNLYDRTKDQISLDEVERIKF